MLPQQNYGVLVRCYTYNHGEYVAEALESFIKQKTNFPFCVLVVDDCSTDNTVSIVKEYEKRYPEIIKGIYLTENLYSQGRSSEKDIYVNPWRKVSKYEAICEGDDWWIDDNKLQKQYDALEAHPDVDMCACETIKFCDNKEVGRIAPSSITRILTVEETITGGGAFLGTNTLFYRTSLMENIMRFYESCRLDYFLQIQGALRGGIYYISECMSAYRVMAKGSWSSRVVMNCNLCYRHICNVIKYLHVLNVETSCKYQDSIYQRLDALYFLLFEYGVRCSSFDDSIQRLTCWARLKLVFYLIRKFLGRKSQRRKWHII